VELPHVRTSDGHRYVYYTAKDDPVGWVPSVSSLETRGTRLDNDNSTENGTWTSITCDLATDLSAAGLTLVQVNAVLIRGSGLIDDIQCVDAPAE
jgi:hypothetical protein